jgi:rare lipoprotein A
MSSKFILVFSSVFVFAACSSTPQRSAEIPSVQSITSGGFLPGDGPDANAPENLDSIPNAIPRAEPLHRYANRQYVALGKTYVPLIKPGNYKERGSASWYGKKFHGKRTANGEVYDMYAMTAAHPILPLPSYARVTNLSNKKSIVVRVNDRGPFMHSRVIDLSYTAAYKLGIVANGSAEVEVENILPDDSLPPITVKDPVEVTLLEPAAILIEKKVLGSRTIYLQLAAFQSPASAESFHARMSAEFEGSGKQIVLYQKKDGLVRVHIGPYKTHAEARTAAVEMEEKLGFRPFLSLH